jgi:hypothetical protein
MESYVRLPFGVGAELLVSAVTRLAGIAEQAAGGAHSALPGWLA